MRTSVTLILLTGSLLHAADWNPKAAAQYLDEREREWFAWKTAQTPEGTCVSCHTGMPYLLARPALRKMLGESAPTEWETKLIARLRENAGHERKATIQGPEAIFGGLILTRVSPGSQEVQAAQVQLRDLQMKDGPYTGIVNWYDAKLDPWESEGAYSWGAALGGLTGLPAPAPTVRWLREHREKAPIHSQLAMLWASPKLPGLFNAEERKALVDTLVQSQRPDGSWTMQAIGEFMAHPDAPPQPQGGHPYATAYTAFILRQSAAAESSAAIAKAQAWLKANQNPTTGAWFAPSMNKKYPEDSMMYKFMQDAATSFAVLALAD